MPDKKSKKKIKVRDQQPMKDPKGGHHHKRQKRDEQSTGIDPIGQPPFNVP